MSADSTDDPMVATEGSRRSLILRRAARLFSEHGYDRTTIREIAQAVGMQSGSLFYHFPTKDHILAAIITDSMAWGLSIAEASVTQARTPRGRFHALLHGHLRALLDEDSLHAHRVSIREWNHLPRPLREPIERLADAYRALWWQVMDELEGARLLQVSKDVFYHFCIGGLNWTAWWCSDRSPAAIERLAQDYLALLLPDDGH